MRRTSQRHGTTTEVTHERGGELEPRLWCPDRAREMIHRFNDLGMRSLDPRGGWPSPPAHDDDRELIVTTAKAHPSTLGRPFTLGGRGNEGTLRKKWRDILTYHEQLSALEHMRGVPSTYARITQ